MRRVGLRARACVPASCTAFTIQGEMRRKTKYNNDDNNNNNNIIIIIIVNQLSQP
jgi:hypothetical protein